MLKRSNYFIFIFVGFHSDKRNKENSIIFYFIFENEEIANEVELSRFDIYFWKMNEKVFLCVTRKQNTEKRWKVSPVDMNKLRVDNVAKPSNAMNKIAYERRKMK